MEPSASGPIEFESYAGIGAALAPTPDGLQVASVFEGGPAKRAGLTDGDLIVAVDGRPPPSRLCERLPFSEAVRSFRLTVRRGARDVELTCESIKLVE
jgi:C-terminal processing protease CtpA/Prc